MQTPTSLSRRSFLQRLGALPLAAVALGSRQASAESTLGGRRFHACLSGKAIAANPELLEVVSRAGVTDIWQPAFFYGHWYASPDELRASRSVVEDAGLHWHLINLPLGHPGDSLGDSTGATPLTPPGRWHLAQRLDGTLYSGTSLHDPATQENVAALQALAPLAPDMIFLDDDFRLATGPGVIGGCYCPEHRARFLDTHGHGNAQWDALLADVHDRRLTPLLRQWVEFNCDELTACFRAQQAAIPHAALGNMIMYMGAEKAGIRLADYAAAPFRVGELMFDDNSFSPVKGKTDELFSALFHRRFARRDLAYSETTAYPHDRLSSRNIAAKLAISTLADVPNTMFMSGLEPFPIAHWDTLAPAMREQTRIHALIAGHRPQGPLKHFWGEAGRYTGDDRPFSLFLALGIPFEVANTMPDSGIVFLGDQDAQHEPATASGAIRIARPSAAATPPGGRPLDETLEALWPLKRELIAGEPNFPHIVEDSPAVCAWYPSANAALVWNLSETPADLTLRHRDQSIKVALAPLALKHLPL